MVQVSRKFSFGGGGGRGGVVSGRGGGGSGRSDGGGSGGDGGDSTYALSHHTLGFQSVSLVNINELY